MKGVNISLTQSFLDKEQISIFLYTVSKTFWVLWRSLIGQWSAKLEKSGVSEWRFICMWLLGITVCACFAYVCLCERGRERNTDKVKECKNIFYQTLLLSKNMIIFQRVGTQSGRAMDALSHEIPIFCRSFYFYSKVSSCRMHYTHQPVCVKALHQNNTNIRLHIPFRLVVQIAVLRQSMLCSKSMIQHIKYDRIKTSVTLFDVIVSPLWNKSFHYFLVKCVVLKYPLHQPNN